MADNQPNITNPASLSGVTIRKGGGIFQDPTSPAAAKGVGANEDQAKMAGTKTQKQAVIKEAVKPIQSTTITPQGLAAAEGQEVSQEKQQAEALQQFASYGDRVKAIASRKYATGIAGDVAGLKAADKSTLDLAFQSDAQVGDKTISQYLEEYANSVNVPGVTLEQQERPLVELSQALLDTAGMYVTKEQLAEWYQPIAESIAATATEEIDDNIIMSDFTAEDLQSLGYESAEEIAGLIGADAQSFGTMSLGEFQEAVEVRRQEIYTEVQELQRQLALAPPGSQVANQIQQRLSDLSGAGVATTEKRMEELVETMNTDIMVDIGGQEYHVEELLSDDNVSQFVIDYLAATPEDREAMFPEGYEGFEAWVLENEETLKAVVAEQEKVAGGFGDTQEALIGFETSYDAQFPPELLAQMGMTPAEAGSLTTEEFNQYKADFEASNVGQILTSPDLKKNDGSTLTAADKQLLVDKVSANYDTVKEWHPQKLVNRGEMADIAQAPDSTMSRFTTISGDFVPDNQVNEFRDQYGQARVLDNKVSTVNRDIILNDPDLVALLQDGTLNAGLLLKADDNLAAQSEAQGFADSFENYAETGKIDEEYQKIKQWASTGDPDAQALLKKYQYSDFNNDGKIDETEVKAIQERVKEGSSIEAFLTQQKPLRNAGKLLSMTDTGAPKEGSIYSKMNNMLTNDGTIDGAEARKLLEEHGNDASRFLNQFDDIPQNETDLAKIEAKEAVEAELKAVGKDLELSLGFDKINLAPDGTIGLDDSASNATDITGLGNKYSELANKLAGAKKGRLYDSPEANEAFVKAMEPKMAELQSEIDRVFSDYVEREMDRVYPAIAAKAKKAGEQPVPTGTLAIETQSLVDDHDQDVKNAYNKILRDNGINPKTWQSKSKPINSYLQYQPPAPSFPGIVGEPNPKYVPADDAGIVSDIAMPTRAGQLALPQGIGGGSGGTIVQSGGSTKGISDQDILTGIMNQGIMGLGM